MVRGLLSAALILVVLALVVWAIQTGTGEPDAPLPEEPKRVLPSPVAGSWYDSDALNLRTELAGYLKEVQTRRLPDVRAMILPHAGYRWSGRVAAHGYHQIEGRKFRRVLVLGPSHRFGHQMENMASVPAVTHYATPLGEVSLDRGFIRALKRHRFFMTFPGAHRVEHSVHIQVPMLQQALGEFLLVPVLLGTLDLETTRSIARILLGLIDDETLVIASTDFTHYGPRFRYIPFRDSVPEKIEKLDMGAFAQIQARSDEGFRNYIEKTGATVCGRHAVAVLLAMLRPDTGVHLMKQDRSGRMEGNYTHSVSYLAVAFDGEWPDADRVPAPGEPRPLTEEERKRLLGLARGTLHHWFRFHEIPTPETLGIEITESMMRPSGAFVTLKRKGQLRGCIGQIYAMGPLYKAVMRKVVDSAVHDNRFAPVEAVELSELEISISALTEPRPVASREEIVLGRHGIILDKADRRSLFLPQVAPEQGWNLEQTLTQLSRKAGLPEDAWKEGATFSVFEAEVFGEAGE
ncbi:MAG: AmmeMemoRadiSam system protein B [Planctomycetota bacterium]|jgi:AmmeMemoRadiSam system protein B/AmmeMemoRadiSam system protein A